MICACSNGFGQVQKSCSQIISGEVRDKVTINLLEDAEVILSNDENIILETHVIKKDGLFSFKVDCDLVFKLEVKKDGFIGQSKTITTTNEVDKEVKLLLFANKDISNLYEGEEFESQFKNVICVLYKNEKLELFDRDKFKVSIQPVYFNYRSAHLNMKARKHLKKVVNLMEQYPKMIIECGGFTDSKGSLQYNQQLSDKRAKKVVDYIVRRGIAQSRISGKGYGAEFLVNNCRIEKCTNEERALNRRTNMIVIKI